MVYRGKPSAGCENCRKAKKRCGLEKPACSRCVKLKKLCSGYRDTTGLQIEDESEAVRLKAGRQKSRNLVFASDHDNDMSIVLADRTSSPHSVSSSSSDDTVETSRHGGVISLDRDIGQNSGYDDQGIDSFERRLVIPTLIKPRADDIATSVFYHQFTSADGHWGMLRNMGTSYFQDPTLVLAMRACGMASLNNTQQVVRGRDLSRIYYAEALGRLNAALQDPERCKADESLMAVALLGYYENLTCDSQQSITSWKEHVKGATQLLRLRGKQQFGSAIGRMLFREMRAQIMISCMWGDTEPPSFLVDWSDELDDRSVDTGFDLEPADGLVRLTYDYAVLKYKIEEKIVTSAEAMRDLKVLEMRMVDWRHTTMQRPLWNYHEIEVNESPHVWNGIVHSYAGSHVGAVWNTSRCIRIMLSHTQDEVHQRLGADEEATDAHTFYVRSVRRQMTDEICGAIPSQLGHAWPAWSSPVPLLAAYSSVWPLFFAGTSVLDRISCVMWVDILTGKGMTSYQSPSAAAAQAVWVLGRLDYISKHIGLRWADGIVSTLKGQFAVHSDLLPP